MAHRPINSIILHCTDTPASRKVTLQDIRRWHVQERGWEDVGYHFIVDQQGTIIHGRPTNRPGAHCNGHNQNSIGVCYIGGLSEDGKEHIDTRTPEQRKALVELVKALMWEFGLRVEHIHCHNEYSNKSCPCFTREDFIKEYWQSF